MTQLLDGLLTYWGVTRFGIDLEMNTLLVATIQQAALSAREQADAALAPYQENLPDLPDLFPGMPSLKDLIPAPPPVVSPKPQRHDDDEPPESFMDPRGSKW